MAVFMAAPTLVLLRRSPRSSEETGVHQVAELLDVTSEHSQRCRLSGPDVSCFRRAKRQLLKAEIKALSCFGCIHV